MKQLIALLLLCSALVQGQTTASDNVKIFELEAPQLGGSRTVWVYLPKAYNTTHKRYPVLYMHDAQNLFDQETSYSGEWMVDEHLNAHDGRKVIVIGIAHGEEKRMEELTPFSHKEYGGGGAKAYLEFLVQTLKPHVDTTYRTLPGRENTGIMGSSLGGLVSFYALLEYPKVFGQAGVFSPSFWINPRIFDRAKVSRLLEGTKMYFLAGTAESEQLVTEVHKMLDILRENGMPERDLKFQIVKGGKHNEAFWGAHFTEAFNWLYPASFQGP